MKLKTVNNELRKLQSLTTLSFALILCSCAGSRAPEVSIAGPPPQHQPYLLGFGDIIEVRFPSYPEMDDTLRVRPDGVVSMPLMDEIRVQGMTVSRLDELIEARYGEVINEPEVVVNLLRFGDGVAYVLGQVGTPGVYNIEQDMTLSQMIATAGGVTGAAKKDGIWVIRRWSEDFSQVFHIDLRIALNEDNGPLDEKDFRIQARDIIFVPETLFAKTSSGLSEVFSRLLLPAAGMYVQYVNFNTLADN